MLIRLANDYTVSRERRGMPARRTFDALAPLVGFSVGLGCIVEEIPLSIFSSICGTSSREKAFRRIAVIFTTFVNDPNQTMFLCLGIRHDFVELAGL